MKLNYFLIASFFILIFENASAQITNKNESLEYQLATKDLLRRSENVTDPQLLLLLAKQSGLFAERYGFENEIHADLLRLAYRAKKASLIDSIYQSSGLITREVATRLGDSILNQYPFPPDPKEKRFNKSYNKPVATRSVMVSGDGSYMFSTTGDGRILKWKTKERTFEQILADNKFDRISALSPNERWLAIGTNENLIKLIDLQQASLKPEAIPHHRGAIIDLEFLPDNSGFISVGIDRRIIKRDFDKGESTLVSTFPEPATDMALSSKGTDLAVISRKGKVILYDLTDSNAVQSELYTELNDNHSLEEVQFSNSGRFLSLGGSNSTTGFGYVFVYDLEEKKPHGPVLRGFTSGITEIEFSDNDQWVAASSRDNTTRVWKLQNLYDFPIILDDHDGGWVLDISFHPNNETLFTASRDGIIRSFNLDYKVYLKDACRILDRNLDLMEWTTFIGDPEKIPLEATCPSTY